MMGLPLYVAGWIDLQFDPHYTCMTNYNGEYGFLKYHLAWNNSRYNELGYLMQAEADPTVRVKYIEEAQEIFAEECPVYPLKQSNRWLFTRTWVKDFVLYNNVAGDQLSFVNTYIAPH